MGAVYTTLIQGAGARSPSWPFLLEDPREDLLELLMGCFVFYGFLKVSLNVARHIIQN